MANDVARAYSDAPSTSSVVVEFCKEVTRLKEFVANFQCRCTARGPQQETGRNVTSTCFATADSEWHVETRVCSDIRNVSLSCWCTGMTADTEDLRSLESIFKDKFEIATGIVGHDGESKNQIKVLNRFISVNDSGYSYEPDVRHSEMIVKKLGLQRSTTLRTPVSDMHRKSEVFLDHDAKMGEMQR